MRDGFGGPSPLCPAGKHLLFHRSNAGIAEFVCEGYAVNDPQWGVISGCGPTGPNPNTTVGFSPEQQKFYCFNKPDDPPSPTVVTAKGATCLPDGLPNADQQSIVISNGVSGNVFCGYTYPYFLAFDVDTRGGGSLHLTQPSSTNVVGFNVDAQHQLIGFTNISGQPCSTSADGKLHFGASDGQSQQIINGTPVLMDTYTPCGGIDEVLVSPLNKPPSDGPEIAQ
jgi:hypothetical protein